MLVVFCLMVGFLFMLVVATWSKKGTGTPPPVPAPADEWRKRERLLVPSAFALADSIFHGFQQDHANLRRDAGILELDFQQIERDIAAVGRSISGRLTPANPLPDPLFLMSEPAPKVQEKPPAVQEVDASIPPRRLDRRKP